MKVRSTRTSITPASRRKQEPPRSVAENIIAIRETLGMSAVQLAETAKLHRQAVWRIESGRVDPSFKNLRRIRAALGVSWDTLLRGVR